VGILFETLKKSKLTLALKINILTKNRKKKIINQVKVGTYPNKKEVLLKGFNMNKSAN